MKTFARIAAITALSAIFATSMGLAACSPSGETAEPQETEVVSSVDEALPTLAAYDGYSLNLLASVQGQSGNDNIMISPYSLMRAMGLVANGAEEQTQSELLAAFGVQSLDELNATMANIEIDDEGFIHTADGLWVNSSQGELAAVFRETVQKLGGTIEDVPFGDSTYADINSWVDANTKGMIKELFSQGDIGPATVLVVANALAFDDNWFEPYNAETDVIDEQFTCANGQTREVPMMVSTESLYLEAPGLTGFAKGYEHGYRFIALLPDEGISTEELLASLDGDAFKQLLNGVDRPVEVEAYLPKFNQSCSTDMLKALEMLGVQRAFADDAQLGGILSNPTEPLKVSVVKQSTFINVDEKGTQAAAATGVGVELASIAEPLEHKVVKLDRPFVYAIVNYQGVPLFMGIVNDPTA